MNSWRRAVLILTIIVASSVCLRAQGETPESTKQFWPEIDVYVPLDEKFQLNFRFTITKARETRENVEDRANRRPYHRTLIPTT